MKTKEKLDIFLGHKPKGCSFHFIDEDTDEISSTQDWPILPSVGDEINLRNGIEWTVTRRQIHYDRFLTVDVYVQKKPTS